MQCDPAGSVNKLLDQFKERYNCTDSKTCTWGLFLPAPPDPNASSTTISTQNSTTTSTTTTNSSSSSSMSNVQPQSPAAKGFSTPSFSPRAAAVSSHTLDSSVEDGAGADGSGLQADGKWLDNDKTLSDYGIAMMTTLELRNTVRAIKITDLDNNLSKTLRITITSTVKQLLTQIAGRFSICDVSPLQYSLQVRERSAGGGGGGGG
eukprot:CAMPEP_0175146486 /NCGR_PEP_ID=MMETSP0087-20121206/15407_1 /TAXON_ID=136419 /ORGANISM="Unknown Unknown, Strain D1" /LENGTH=205 /DNA_ID=CAMNT_0016431457 /DNA_START=157 /DNA_END=771 /DNA_ORIENTATION=-